MKAVILKNELPNSHVLWVKACEAYKESVEYRVVDLTRNDWLDKIKSSEFDVLLTKPGGLTAAFKQLYDERIYILDKLLAFRTYPTANEVFLYENKRFLSFWLAANSIPHPKTDIFYSKSETEHFLQQSKFPIVAKTNIGASGSGVKLLKTMEAAASYITDTFSGKGAEQRSGPNLQKGGILKRGFYYIFHPGQIKQKLEIYESRAKDVQKGFVIFQEFVPHDFEWRVVRIGDSFFAHKKLLKGEKASGSLLKSYENPPHDLLQFVKEITDKHKLYSMAVDLFECSQGYLVNEMQCIFGQSDSYQMLVDGEMGRYICLENEWKFEKGDFNQNESYNLRIEYLLNLIS